MIDNATLNTAGGTVTLTGHGGAANANSGGFDEAFSGVGLELNGLVNSGGGNITINGTGGTATGDVGEGGNGVEIYNTLNSAGGTIAITGNGRVGTGDIGGLTGSDSTLVGATITSGAGATGFTGAVEVIATNTVSSMSNNVSFSSTIDGSSGSLTVSSGSGTVTFTGAVGSTTPLTNLTVGGNYTFGSTVAVAGTFSIAPGDPTQSIGVFGDTGTFQVTKADMDALETLTGAANIAVGDIADSGLMRVAGARSDRRGYGLSLASGSGNIQFDGVVSAQPGGHHAGFRQEFFGCCCRRQ